MHSLSNCLIRFNTLNSIRFKALIKAKRTTGLFRRPWFLHCASWSFLPLFFFFKFRFAFFLIGSHEADFELNHFLSRTRLLILLICANCSLWLCFASHGICSLFIALLHSFIFVFQSPLASALNSVSTLIITYICRSNQFFLKATTFTYFKFAP